MADGSGKTNKVWWRQTARGGGDRQVKGGDHYQPLSGHFYRGRGKKMMMVKKEKEKGLVSKSKEVTTINHYQATSIREEEEEKGGR